MAAAGIATTRVLNTDATTGNVRQTFWDVTFTSVGGDTYTAGGIFLDPHSVGLLFITGVDFIAQATTTGSAQSTQFIFAWDFKTGKIQAFTATAAGNVGFSELAGGTTLTASGLITQIVRVQVTGY